MPTDRQAPAAGALPTVLPYVDAERFISLVVHAPDLALVDFTAAWCPPCRMQLGGGCGRLTGCAGRREPLVRTLHTG